jgi:putative nucleotidyltransferase with HDIG domain
MLTRIKQFIAAMTAEVTASDRLFVDRQLNDREKALFYDMNLPDQRHALNVAYTAEQLAASRPEADLKLLLKCALLHDVGKVKGDVSTLDKVITVLADKFFPQWARRWGCLGRGGRVTNLRHAFYIYFNHGERGAKMLAASGVSSNITDIVRKHHAAPQPGEPPELAILRQADNMH